jgi:Leucine-rich repeat (LRR) protein
LVIATTKTETAWKIRVSRSRTGAFCLILSRFFAADLVKGTDYGNGTFVIPATTVIHSDDFEIAPKFSSTEVKWLQLVDPSCDWYSCREGKSNVKHLPVRVGEVFPKLERFNVRGFQVRQISKKNLRNLHELTELDLKYNEIEFIADDSFDDLRQLDTLLFGNNKLTNLRADTFKGLTKLGLLDLGSNQLTALPENIFDDLLNLTGIDLSNNSLTTLPDSIFGRNEKFAIILLSHNRISKLSAKVFDNKPYLRQVHLENNVCIDKKYVRSSDASFDVLKSDLDAQCL